MHKVQGTEITISTMIVLTMIITYGLVQNIIFKIKDLTVCYIRH